MTPTFIRKVQSSFTLGPPHWKRCMSPTRYTLESTKEVGLTSTALWWKWQSIQHSTAYTDSHVEPQTTEVPDEAEILLNTEGYASDSDLPSDPVDSESLSFNYRRSHSHQTWPTCTDQTLLPLQSSSVNSIQTHVMNTYSRHAPILKIQWNLQS